MFRNLSRPPQLPECERRRPPSSPRRPSSRWKWASSCSRDTRILSLIRSAVSFIGVWTISGPIPKPDSGQPIVAGLRHSIHELCLRLHPWSSGPHWTVLWGDPCRRPIQGTSVSFSLQANNTNDGVYEIHDGVENPAELGKIASWNGKKTVDQSW